MKKRNGSNVLLVEILLAVLFFMLSATVLVQVFGTSRSLTVRSGVDALSSTIQPEPSSRRISAGSR